MPRSETVLTVFVASPSDVSDERDILEDVIREMNVTWRKTLSVSMELVRWETHASPGISVDPQKVINEDIGDDYDIFIGIIWSRFGSKTSTHESGTEEEFRRAFDRWSSDPESVRIMFYFNQNGMPIDTLDLKQLEKIRDFKKSLGEEGILYWNYKDKENFKDLVRLHLSRKLQQRPDVAAGGQGAIVPNKNASAKVEAELINDEDALGFIDLLEVIEEDAVQLNQVLMRLTKALEEVGRDAEARTEELQALERNKSGGIIDYKSAKRIVTLISQDLDRFNRIFATETPLFKETNEKIARASSNLAMIMRDFDRESDAELAEMSAGLKKLIDSLDGMGSGLSSFHESVARIPRMTIRFNQSRRSTLTLIGEFLDMISESAAVYSESRAIIEELRRN